MPAKTKQKIMHLLIKLAPEPAKRLRQLAAEKNRSASAQAKTIIETSLSHLP